MCSIPYIYCRDRDESLRRVSSGKATVRNEEVMRPLGRAPVLLLPSSRSLLKHINCA